jgi:hypothetical protein
MFLVTHRMPTFSHFAQQRQGLWQNLRFRFVKGLLPKQALGAKQGRLVVQ